MKEERYLEKAEKNIKTKYHDVAELLEKREFNEAEKLLLEIKSKQPNFVPLYNKWGIIHIHRKDYKEAKTILNQAIQIDNSYAPAITNLGSIMRKEGNIRKAKELYKKAIEVDPEYGLAYNNLGVIYREEGNYTQSVKNLKKARKYGDYHVDLSSDKPFYKEPGCLFVMGIIFIIIVIILFMLK